MFKKIRFEQSSPRTTRIVFQVIVCLLLLLGFYVGVDAVAVPSTGSLPMLGSGGAKQLDVSTLTPTLARTSPTPTKSNNTVRSPVSVIGQTQVDNNTVALYHFDAPTGDNTVIDATGRFTGTLHGGATITTSGLYAGVLQLNGAGSYVRTGHLGGYDFSQGTIEAFVDFGTACRDYPQFIVFSAGGEFGSNAPILKLGYAIKEGGEGYIQFGIWVIDHWVYADGAISCRYLGAKSADVWPYETWRFRHVAGTWGPRGIEIWVDGILHGIGTYPPELITFYYRCTPQMQLGMGLENSNIPICPTPILVPQMIATPPGDYSGALPDYNTFIIGCSAGTADGSCFEGRIDEVRISNLQRTFTKDVDPTITPLPTQTPDRILSAYTIDSATNGFYHLDYADSLGRVYDDVSGQLNGWFRGNPSIFSPGWKNGATSLDGNASYISLPPSAQGYSSGAVEAWFRLYNTAQDFTVISNGTEPTSPIDWRFLFIGVQQGLYGANLGFGINNNSTGWYWAGSGVTPSSLRDCWHHVAGTWGARGMELWLDGFLIGRNSFTGAPLVTLAPYNLGCASRGNCLAGSIDEVRISSLQRSFSASALSAPARSPAGQRLPAAGEMSNYLPFVQVVPPPACPFGR